MKEYDNKTIEKLIFRYFNIRNFEISKFQSFYISSFKILTPTPDGVINTRRPCLEFDQ